MKKAIVIFLSTIILCSAVSNGLIYFGFKIKQTDIIEKLCINKLSNKECKGKCYLKAQLEKNNDDSSTETPFSSFSEQIKIKYIPLFTDHLNDLSDSNSNQVTFIHLFSFQKYTSCIFRPPIQSSLLS